MIETRDICDGISIMSGERIRGQKIDIGKVYIITISGEHTILYEEVEPDSIHRCTGCEDKNGNCVFEGDKIYDKQGFIGRAAFDNDEGRWDILSDGKFLGRRYPMKGYKEFVSFPWYSEHKKKEHAE